MSEKRHRNAAIASWNGLIDFSYEHLPLAYLAAIHDELLKLNRTLGCRNVARGFTALQRIARLDELAFKRRVEAAVKKTAERKKSATRPGKVSQLR